MSVSALKIPGSLDLKAAPMAAADPVFESFQRLQSMMESFDESLSQLCKDNSSESAIDLRKNLVEYYHDLHKALQLKYETLKIKEKKPEEPETRGKNKENKTSKATGSSPASSAFSKVLSSVGVHPEIKTFCDSGDSQGLRIYIADFMKHRNVDMKEVELLRNELVVALSKAPDAAKLVIRVLEGCDLSKSLSHTESNGPLSAAANGKACCLLMESLSSVFGNNDSDVVPSDVKDLAREIAKVWWKEMQTARNLESSKKFDVQPVLQLLSTFRLTADYEKDELLGLVCTILRRKQTPELFRSLGLSAKVPDVIHKLPKDRPTMPLRYAHVCGMMDKMDPVGLLTSHLRRVEEAAKKLLTNGHGSVDSQITANMKMVSALGNVIGCVEEYGLQSGFCVDDLQNKLRILVQEKERLKRKRKQDPKSKAQEEEDREKAAKKKAQEEEDREKAAKKKAQEEEDRKKAAEKCTAEKGTDKKQDAKRKRYRRQKTEEKAAEKKVGEKEDREKAAEKKAQEEEDREKADKKKAQEKEDRDKDAEKKVQETEDRKKATDKRLMIKEKKPEESRTRGKNKENKTSKVTGSSPTSFSFSKVFTSVEAHPEIKTLCDKGDARGLRIYIANIMKDRNVDMGGVETLRNELQVALGKAPDAAKLVIKVLDGCDLSKSGSHTERNEPLSGTVNGKACCLLMESLSSIFGNNDSDVVPSDVKDSARAIAKVWWKEMQIARTTESGKRFDAQPILQLLSTFRLAAEYKKDELMGLLCTILRRKQAPELFRSLGLSSKVPDVIHKLPNDRPNMPLRYAHVCGMMDKIDPVGLLTSYLRRVEEAAKELLTNGHGSADSQITAKMKMVSTLENVIELIKEYGLQSDFCVDGLQNKLRILVQEKEDLKRTRKQDPKINVQEEDKKKAAKKKAQEKQDKEKAAEKKVHEMEDRKNAVEKRLQNKRGQSFEPGYGLSEKENYASKRAKHASPNETTRVASGMGNSKASPYNIDGVQKESGIIGHDQHTSAFSAANRSSTGLAAAPFTSAPSIAAQINDERRCVPSAFGTISLTHIGSSLYSSNVPTGASAVPLYNVAEVKYEGRGQESYTMNPGEVDKNHVRASVYRTGDLAKPSATHSNYNYEGRGQQSYKLNFGEVDNNPVGTSAYGTGVLANSSATQSHYERRVPELYTSAFGGGNTGSIGSSVYGSNSRTIPSSDVVQGGHERSLGQYSGFAGRNIVPFESSGYRPGVSTVPPSNVNQGDFESRRSVIDRYRFSNGLTS